MYAALFRKMYAAVIRKKNVKQVLAEQEGEEQALSLKKSLGPLDLTFMGIGCIIGTGIFVATGQAAAGTAQSPGAGPAIMITFLMCGIACALAALCYAEFAALLPISGSAYTYSYATMGELMAWVIGWDLTLEYGISAAAIAVGWSGYFNEILAGVGTSLGINLKLPIWASKAYMSNDHAALRNLPGDLMGFFGLGGHTWNPAFGLVDIPAGLVILGIAGILSLGVKESARANGIMVVVKLSVLALFIFLGLWHIHPENWTPFAPNGWKGISGAVSAAFFSYIGFDAVSTTSEEARNPQRDLPIGIIASLVISTVLYMITAAVMTGVLPYKQLAGAAPMATVLKSVGIQWGSLLVSFGAIAGIASVILVSLYGQARIFFVMARDGLLPPFAARIHPRFHTPAGMTMLTGAVVAVMAAVIPLEVILDLTSIGTLFAFVLVCAAVVILRYTDPDQPRPFRCPGAPVVPVLGALSCLYLMTDLKQETWIRFGVWLVVGFVIYFGYGIRHSILGRREAAAAARQ